jgi:hypothetical protein
VYVTEVIADNVQFLKPKGSGGSGYIPEGREVTFIKEWEASRIEKVTMIWG